MKFITEKFRAQNDSFPKSLTIANEEISDKISFFVNTCTNLPVKRPHGTTNFESHLPNITTTSRESSLTEEEFKNALFLLRERTLSM